MASPGDRIRNIASTEKFNCAYTELPLPPPGLAIRTLGGEITIDHVRPVVVTF